MLPYYRLLEIALYSVLIFLPFLYNKISYFHQKKQNEMYF